MVEIEGVLLGAGIGFLSAFGTRYLVWKFIEKPRWEKEKEIEREKFTIEYFRRFFDALAPFLAMEHQFDFIMGGQLSVGEVPTKTQQEQIIDLIPKFIDAYKIFVEKGYSSILPTDLAFQIRRYGNFLNGLKIKLDEKPDFTNWDDKDWEILFRLQDIGTFVKRGIRQLLGIESLDNKIRM